METIATKKEISDSSLIGEIEAIEHGRVFISKRDSIKIIVEFPLVEACEELYDKNIQTLFSSANSKDVGFFGGILIDFNSLSDENKKIAEEIGNIIKLSGGAEMVRLDFNITNQTTVADVKKEAKEKVSKFRPQEMTWARKRSREDIAKIYSISPEDVTPENQLNLYYDKKSELFYDSEEQFKKANNLK